MLKQNLKSNGAAFALSTIFSLLINTFSSIQFEHWYYLGPIFFLLFFLSGLISTYRSKLDDFTAYLLLNLSLKLLFAFICIAFWAFLYKNIFLAISLHFILYFLTFTGFEIRYIYLLVKIKSEIKTK